MADRVRFFFDDIGAAAQGLITVLQFARDNEDAQFVFGPMKAQAVLKSGLWIEGDIDQLAAILEQDSGVVRDD